MGYAKIELDQLFAGCIRSSDMPRTQVLSIEYLAGISTPIFRSNGQVNPGYASVAIIPVYKDLFALELIEV